MKFTNRTAFSLIVFGVVFLLDFVLKKMSLGWESGGSILGLIDIGYVAQGASQKSFQDPNSTIRAIHYATFLGPLLLIYFFLLSQMVKKTSVLYFQPWLTLWVVGLVGNIADRMMYGHVVNWMQVKAWGCTFNIASLAVLIGLVGCLVQAYRHRKEVFQFYWKRKMTMTHPKFQSLFILKIIAISLFLAISMMIFSYTFLKFYVFQFGIIIPKPMLRVFLIESGLIMAVFTGILLLMGLYYSSKIAGPLYAFQQFIERLKNGEDPTFKLREDDDMKELEGIAEDIKKHWKS